MSAYSVAGRWHTKMLHVTRGIVKPRQRTGRDRHATHAAHSKELCEGFGSALRSGPSDQVGIELNPASHATEHAVSIWRFASCPGECPQFSRTVCRNASTPPSAWHQPLGQRQPRRCLSGAIGRQWRGRQAANPSRLSDDRGLPLNPMVDLGRPRRNSQARVEALRQALVEAH